MNRPIEIGLIGCGKQAPKHIEGLLSADHPVNVTVYDLDTGLTRPLIEKYGVKAVDRIESIVDAPGLDAVVIATPTRVHFDLSQRALRSGKHVFCEKPLCSTREEAVALHDIERETGNFLQVGYVYRHVPAFRHIRSILSSEEPAIGRPVYALFRVGGRGSASVWKHQKANGGGAVNEMMVHMLDLAHWFFGRLEGLRFHEQALLRPTRTVRGEEICADAEDFVLASCRGSGGVHVVIQADLVTPSFQQFAEVHGENGSMAGSIQADRPSYIHLSSAAGDFPAGRRDFDLESVNVFRAQMRDFVNNVRRGRAEGCATADDTLQLFDLLETN